MSSKLVARAVVFDLDGTLLDSFTAIGASLDHARVALGLAPLPPGAARGMVGHGLDRLIEQAFEPAQQLPAKAIYREHYDQTCVAGTRLLPGAREALVALAGRGFALGVATNKPATFSNKLLLALGVAPLLGAVAGAEPGLRLKPAPDILLHALALLGVAPADALYVGDMHVDLETGRAAGVRVVAVATGAESRAALERAGAETVLEHLGELPDRLTAHAADGPGNAA